MTLTYILNGYPITTFLENIKIHEPITTFIFTIMYRKKYKNFDFFN